MNKLEVINTAKDYMLDHGWVQRNFEDDNGSVCFVGSFTRSQIPCNIKVVQDILLDANKIVGGSAIGWNDIPGRTFDDVMDLFHKLALQAKEELNVKEAN